MKELYWISVLGNLHDTATIFMNVFATTTILAIIAFFVMYENVEQRTINKVVKALKASAIAFIFTVSLAVFVPSKQSLFSIFGVGSTIDFVQENPTAKQLPEKTVKCLDAWCDNFIKEQKEDKK